MSLVAIDHVQLAMPGGCEVDPEFRAARKAHPALAVLRLRKFVEQVGLNVRWSDELSGSVRCHLDDPFGNRIELVDVAP